MKKTASIQKLKVCLTSWCAIWPEKYGTWKNSRERTCVVCMKRRQFVMDMVTVFKAWVIVI